MTKIKTFKNADDKEINEFMKDKTVVDVKVTFSMRQVTLMPQPKYIDTIIHTVIYVE